MKYTVINTHTGKVFTVEAESVSCSESGRLWNFSDGLRYFLRLPLHNHAILSSLKELSPENKDLLSQILQSVN